MNQDELVNRVAQSALVTLDLEEYYPSDQIATIDLKDILFQGLVLREKDLRDFVKQHDWSIYKGKNVAVFCSADAIIPTWASMLLGIALQPFARKVHFGNTDSLLGELFHESMERIDWEKYRDAKVVIKGCSRVQVPASAYLEAAVRLRGLASSIFYGEPCSTVPLFKKAKP